jgi:D-sedoheptulose 7-phosphate isomerase
MKEIIKSELDDHMQTAKLLDNLTHSVATSAQICIDCLKNGGKILIFGNGGSAADAQHIAAELVGRFKEKREGLASIALTTDSSVITSIANDFGFEDIFVRQIEALANPGDVVIGITTSGESKNVIKGLQFASKLKCYTIGFCGQENGILNNICDVNLPIPSNNTARIQEMHILIGHIICHIIDKNFKKLG